MQPTSTEALHSLSPVEFERLVKHLFESLGYQVEVTRRSHDEGIDLLLDKGEEHSIVQCKRFKGQVGQPVVRDFYGTVVHEKAARGYLVTSGTFSFPARTWAEGKNLVLVDGPDLLASMGHLNVGVETRSKPQRKKEQDILKSVIKQARKQGHGGVFPILFEGEPPPGHSYKDLAEALAWATGMKLVYGDCRHTPIATTMCDKGDPRVKQTGLFFLDEIDEAKGKDLGDLISVLEDGALEYREPKGSSRHFDVANTIAVSLWGGRLAPRLGRLFATKIRSSELDWAFVEEDGKRRAKEQAERAAERGAELERSYKEEKRRARKEKEEQEKRRLEAEKQIRELYITMGRFAKFVKLIERSPSFVESMATHCRFCRSESTGPPQALRTRPLGGFFAGKHVEYLVPVCPDCYEKLKIKKWRQDKYGRHWWA
jgi:hypothetical protein